MSPYVGGLTSPTPVSSADDTLPNGHRNCTEPINYPVMLSCRRKHCPSLLCLPDIPVDKKKHCQFQEIRNFKHSAFVSVHFCGLRSHTSKQKTICI